MTDFIRTAKHGCFQVRSNAWGQFLASCPDPEATGELEQGALDRFELHPDIQRIPAQLWSRWVKLCFHFAHLTTGDLEVSCRLLRHEDDKSRWRILVPRQEVSTASVRIDSFDEAIDIETGELVEQYPPTGWVPAGSSHSHNSMPLARFSSTDDASELGCPGLHVVLSHIDTTHRTYRPTASVTANRRRFYLPEASAVIDLTPTTDSFHPAVLEVVQPERPRPTSMWLPGHISRQQDAWQGRKPMWDDDLLSHDEVLHGTPPAESGVCPACGGKGAITDLSTRAMEATVVFRCSDCFNSWSERHDMPENDELAVPSDTIEEERQLLMQELFEFATTLRDFADAYNIDSQQLLTEACDALKFTFRPDDPIHWNHEPDSTQHSASRSDSPVAQELSAGSRQS